MDTICLCKAFYEEEELAPNYKAVLSTVPPAGCITWLKRIPSSPLTCLWIKINCHEMLEVQNLSDTDVDKLTAVVSDWLGTVGLTVNDLNINRIDYDYNVSLPENVREAVIDLLNGLPQQAMRMEKGSFPGSVYYVCKSRHAQVYDKAKERRDKHKRLKGWEEDICRQEVQCLAEHIKHMKRYYGLQPVWSNWVCLDMQKKYLKNAKPIFPRGDFYTMDAAADIIQTSDLKPAKKRKLCNDLQIVANGGLDALKESYCLNTYKDHLNCLESLGVNPLTLPAKYNGLGRVENPFFH